MERTLTLGYPAAIPVGHRVEVAEITPAKGAGESFAVADLDTGIRWHPEGTVTEVWQGNVLACTITPGARTTGTTLVVEIGQERPTGVEAREALDAAASAFAAAQAEAVRWSSAPWGPSANR